MTAGDKIGDVLLRGVKGRCEALWRPTDGTHDVVLCSIDLQAYRDDAQLQKLFIDLAIEAARVAARVVVRLQEPAN
jgi:hypothetical protein